MKDVKRNLLIEKKLIDAIMKFPYKHSNDKVVFGKVDAFEDVKKTKFTICHLLTGNSMEITFDENHNIGFKKFCQEKQQSWYTKFNYAKCPVCKNVSADFLSQQYIKMFYEEYVKLSKGDNSWMR